MTGQHHGEKIINKKKNVIDIRDYVRTDRICFLQASSRDEALLSLVHVLQNTKALNDMPAFYEALLERESIVSTGIGMEVAIPHARIADQSDFFLCIGIQKGKGIEWNSLDKIPVRLIFLVGGPDNRQTDYLQLLSSLTQVIREETLRKKILQVTSAEEVKDLFLSL